MVCLGGTSLHTQCNPTHGIRRALSSIPPRSHPLDAFSIWIVATQAQHRRLCQTLGTTRLSMSIGWVTLTRFRRHGFALPEAVGDSRLQPTSFFLSLPLFWPPCLRRYDDRHLNSRFFKRTAYPLAPPALFQCRSK